MNATSKTDGSRRKFLRGVLAVGVGAAVERSFDDSLAASPTPEEMPEIKLGQLKVSRLILGSNPFFGFAHGNPQGKPDDMKQWYTRERIMAVLDQAADHGITAVWTPCYHHWIDL